MENDYSTQFMTEVHNSMQVVDVPKKRPWKAIVLTSLVVLVIIVGVVVGIILTNKNTEEQQLAKFAEDEWAIVEETTRVLSDPVFSVIPHYDDDNGFYVDAWGTEDGILIKILPLCDPERYDEYLQNAKSWLNMQLGNLSVYMVEIAPCGE